MGLNSVAPTCCYLYTNTERRVQKPKGLKFKTEYNKSIQMPHKRQLLLLFILKDQIIARE